MARETRSVWAKRVEKWKRSGLTGAEYAGQIGVAEGTLRHWKWQLGRERRTEAEAARPTFVEVVAENGLVAEGTGTLEVRLQGGVRIIVPAGFDEDTLRRLLRVVEGR